MAQTYPGEQGTNVVQNITEIEAEIHTLINAERSSRELEQLKYNPELAVIAEYYSWDMANRTYFAHRGPDGRTHTELRKNTVKCRTYGQNLALDGYAPVMTDENFSTSSFAGLVVLSWMNSPGHRANVLHPDYDSQGIGIYVAEDETVYVTQEFCGNPD